MTAYRNFAGLDGNAAIARYEQRRESDAQAPVGATEFDDSGEEDQDLGEFDGAGDDGGATAYTDEEMDAANTMIALANTTVPGATAAVAPPTTTRLL